MRQDGIISTDKDAFVGIRTLGKYESNSGRIIQGKQRTEMWWEKTWVQIIFLFGGLAGITGIIRLLSLFR